jgi:hypothetical protein
VLQVTGLFDGVVIEAIDDAIERAASDGSQALILQVNSGGSIASARRDDGSHPDAWPTRPCRSVSGWGRRASARLYGMPAAAHGRRRRHCHGERVAASATPVACVELDGAATVDFGAAADRLRNGLACRSQDARTPRVR